MVKSHQVKPLWKAAPKLERQVLVKRKHLSASGQRVRVTMITTDSLKGLKASRVRFPVGRDWLACPACLHCHRSAGQRTHACDTVGCEGHRELGIRGPGERGLTHTPPGLCTLGLPHRISPCPGLVSLRGWAVPGSRQQGTLACL